MSPRRQEASENRLVEFERAGALCRAALDGRRRTGFAVEDLERLDRALARRLPAAVAAVVLTPRYSPPQGAAPAHEGVQLAAPSSQVAGQRTSPST